jgi:hypothetical protein
MKRSHVLIMLGVLLSVSIIGGVGYLIHRKMTQSTLGLLLMGDTVKAESLVANLDSTDHDLVMTSLGILADRADPAGRAKAKDLLESEDNYIWFNAALYLGSIGEAEAIPYLVKGLKHPARRSHDEVVALLESMTDQAFGKNQEKWIEWWKTEHPDSAFVFSYPDFEQEASRFDEESHILINGVVDPVRISHHGPEVRLIGVRLKDDASTQDAVKLLHELLAFQFVQLEFDNGPKLDENGARRAFVYWTMSSPSRAETIGRRGLRPVPFKTKTFINAYLLNSGLYELDLASVDSEAMKEALKQAAEKMGPNGVDVQNNE